MAIVYVVRMVESERGWGQNYYDAVFNSYEEAAAHIKTVNEENKEEWELTKRVPDWYTQPYNDKITVREE